VTVTFDIPFETFEELIDMDQASVHVAPPRVLSDELVVEFWGLVLHTRQAVTVLPNWLARRQSEDLFVKGWTRMTFREPQRLGMSGALYEGSSRVFIATSAGDVATIRYRSERVVDGALDEYAVGGMALWPFGDLNAEIRARGVVGLSFEENDVITVGEYEAADLSNPPYAAGATRRRRPAAIASSSARRSR